MIDSCLNKKDEVLTLSSAKEKCFLVIDKQLIQQKVEIRSALSKVLSQDVIAPINVPSYPNSAMDGYALRKIDLSNNQPFTILATAYAGKPINQAISHNQCIQIMTGALIPEHADIVIPQEFTQQQGDKVNIQNCHGGDNIRLAGEDLAKGSIALEKGHLLNAADLGLLASLGITEINVWRSLRVAFFSTGDELRGLTQSLGSGQIYDSNRYSLYGLLSNLNVDILDMGVVKDDPAALKEAFIQASQYADVIITTGGVSVGQADFVKQVLKDVGQINFWKLAIKPGRPLTFGKIDKAYFFGLPGNPVATMITFYQIVQPFLKIMMGQNKNIEPLLVNATSLSDIVKSPGRDEFLRANFNSINGKLSVQKLSKQGSGVLSSMSKANCLIVLSAQRGDVKVGDTVQIQPFYGLL